MILLTACASFYGFLASPPIQPRVYFNTDSTEYNTEEHLGDLVWMIDAQR